MSITQTEARNAVFRHFNECWADTGYFAAYDDVPKEPSDAIRKALTPWARASVDIMDNGSMSIGSEEGALWECEGLLKIQVFTASGRGASISDQLVQLLKDHFRAKTAGNGEVWFRSMKQDQAPDGAWFMQCLYIRFIFHEAVASS